MTFLPIIHRELRVALRKRATFLSRMVTPIFAGLIACAIYTFNAVLGNSSQAGRTIYDTITWFSLAAVLAAGLFLTSDCLSEEKREGTLGFLFLTDLKGYDVVLGKLAATSLRCFYALLAMLPVFCFCLLFGGVTGGRFFKTSLALVNALLCSLAVGLFVSSISRQAQKAMAGTLAILLLICGGGPLADVALEEALHRPHPPWFSLASPWYVFQSATAWGPTPFWQSLLASFVLSLIFFGCACAFVPRTWKDKPKSRGNAVRGYEWKYGSERRREAFRRKVIDHDPVAWLSLRERWQSVAIWILAILVTGGALLLYCLGSDVEFWMAASYIIGLVSLALYIAVASQACRFFVDAGRSGLIELLLASPQNEKQIVNGHARALLRQFGWPVLLIITTGILVSLLRREGFLAVSGQATVFQISLSILSSILSGITTLGNLIALAWYSMWLGMTSRNANVATLKALGFAQILPMMVISFGGSMLVMWLMIPQMVKSGGSAASSWGLWMSSLMLITNSTLSLVKDFAFWRWSRKKLYTSFRTMAARGTEPARPAIPPLLQPAPAPPIIIR